jgi:hypothetical protein
VADALDHHARRIEDRAVASLERERPVAWALIVKMRPVLGLLKRLGTEMPDMMAQAAMALRYHAYEGNTKWTSLLLWAGADPCERGPHRIEELEGDPAWQMVA